jgi:3-oxoacyl-[acyl-carrier-protein] synthase III
MFILASSDYVPRRIVDNDYFSRLLDKPVTWFEQRTGIRQRHRAEGDENVHTMALAAVAGLRDQGALPSSVDLIIAASYTPLDTIGTMAHVIQRAFEWRTAKAMYLSTACSSFLDALDVAAMYFKAGRINTAVIVAAEHNSKYARDADITSGHLWGDGASAVVLGSSSQGATFEVIETQTKGCSDLGHGPDAISLTHEHGLMMPHGREVFAQACTEMARAVRNILASNNLGIDDIQLLIPHQANKRIIDHVAKDLGVPTERAALTVDHLGNTGCASVAITFHRNAHRVPVGGYAVLVTFGGGYSAGAALLRRLR